MPQSSELFEQLIQRIDPQSKLLRIWDLSGGFSAQVTAIEFTKVDGQTERIIVRQLSGEHLERNPQAAEDEFRILQLAHSLELPSPTPYHQDQSCEIFPTPYLVIEYIDGEPNLAPANLDDCMYQMASQLASIHGSDCSNLDTSFLPDQTSRYNRTFSNRPARIDESLDVGRIRDALEPAWPWPQHNEPTFLHGDFWPGNILWRDEQLVGVIDWEDANFGDPLADIAISRLEILWAYGINAMHRFTRHYQSLTSLDFANLPYWDLCAALRPAFNIDEWAGDSSKAKVWRRRHKLFVTLAFERLPSRS